MYNLEDLDEILKPSNAIRHSVVNKHSNIPRRTNYTSSGRITFSIKRIFHTF
jgi:hypothetical protein